MNKNIWKLIFALLAALWAIVEIAAGNIFDGIVTSILAVMVMDYAIRAEAEPPVM